MGKIAAEKKPRKPTRAEMKDRIALLQRCVAGADETIYAKDAHIAAMIKTHTAHSEGLRERCRLQLEEAMTAHKELSARCDAMLAARPSAATVCAVCTAQLSEMVENLAAHRREGEE